MSPPSSSPRIAEDPEDLPVTADETQDYPIKPSEAPSSQNGPSHSKMLHFAAGGLAGSLGAVFTAPLDVLKTRLQASAKLQSVQAAQTGRFATRTFRALVNIFETEGLNGLFRGLGPNLVGIVPSRAIYFMTYNTTRELVVKYVDAESPLVAATSAAAAGVTVSTLMNPVWFVKTRIQLESATGGNQAYNGYVDCMRKVYHTEGLGAFYKGLTASFLGILESGSYFIIYERMKSMVRRQKLRSGESEAESVETVKISPIETMVLSGSAKFLATSATYPHEVIRTRMRERSVAHVKHNVFSIGRHVVQNEGVRGLYSGMGAHLIRVVPNTAIMFLTYEGIVAFVNKHK